MSGTSPRHRPVKSSRNKIHIENLSLQRKMMYATFIATVLTLLVVGATFYQGYQARRAADIAQSASTPKVHIVIESPMLVRGEYDEPAEYFLANKSISHRFKDKLFAHQTYDAELHISIYNVGIVPVTLDNIALWNRCGESYNLELPERNRILLPDKPQTFVTTLNLDFHEDTYRVIDGKAYGLQDAPCNVSLFFKFNSFVEEKSYWVKFVG